MKSSPAILSALLLLSPFAHSGELAPGKWDLSVEMDAPGMPENMRKRVQQDCLTPELAEDPEGALKKNWKQDNCDVGEIKRAGDTLSWSADCTFPGTNAKTNITGKMVVHDEKHYTTEMTVKGNNHTMTTRTEARWAGVCD